MTTIDGAVVGGRTGVEGAEAIAGGGLGTEAVICWAIVGGAGGGVGALGATSGGSGAGAEKVRPAGGDASGAGRAA